jgi:hypothetical protein
MLRFFSIVICSFLVSTTFGQSTYSWTITSGGFRLDRAPASGFVSQPATLQRSTNGTVFTNYLNLNITYSGTLPSFNYGLANSPVGIYRIVPQANILSSPLASWNGTNATVFTPDESQSYSWEFGPEWSGVEIQVLSASGDLLAVGVVPQGGGVISGTIIAPSLAGAQVYADGVLIGPLDETVELEPVSFSVGRGAFEFGFDASYGGVDWQIRRQDSSVATSGSVPVNGYATDGNFTLNKSESGEVFTFVDIGDGPSEWVSTGVIVNPNTQNFFSFVNNSYQVQPLPMPTPGVLSPAPIPSSAPTNVATPSITVEQPNEPDGLLTVEVEQLDLPDIEDNESDLIATVGVMQQLTYDIVQNIRESQDNLINAAHSLNGLRLSGVGRKCTFQMGPASIEIQTSGAVRAGLTLLVVGLAAFAAASMIRSAVQ